VKRYSKGCSNRERLSKNGEQMKEEPLNYYSVEKLWEDFDLWFVFRNSKLVAKFDNKKTAERFLELLKREVE